MRKAGKAGKAVKRKRLEPLRVRELRAWRFVLKKLSAGLYDGICTGIEMSDADEDVRASMSSRIERLAGSGSELYRLGYLWPYHQHNTRSNWDRIPSGLTRIGFVKKVIKELSR